MMVQTVLLPNLRNLGVNLRIILLVNGLLLFAVVFTSFSLNQAYYNLITYSSMLQPILMFSLCALYLSYPLLKKLPYYIAILVIIGVVLLVSTTLYKFTIDLFAADIMSGETAQLLRLLALSFMTTLMVIGYFYLRLKALNPAVNEARLQALQARIRPHFLFNCINSVLSVVRSDPKRAATALEDMADLFRVLMSENRDLVPLADEISLCKQYLALEQLRLEERLQIDWQIEATPLNVKIPPLLLQPLLENAVYHGVEPLVDGGVIKISMEEVQSSLEITINNPYSDQNQHHKGNNMALANIRERLSLHFDVEAALTSKNLGDRYEVTIKLPLKHEG